MASRQQLITAEHVDTLFNCSIQEAAKKLPIDLMFPAKEGETSKEEKIGLTAAEISKMVWCQLSETRLASLVCKYRPIGSKSAGNMERIHDRMNNIYDNEDLQCEMYVEVSARKKFVDTIAARQAGKRRVVRSYTPIYGIRPSVEDIERKLNHWFAMNFLRKMHAENEAKEKAEKDKKDEGKKSSGEEMDEEVEM